jgi:hypothetical protein
MCFSTSFNTPKRDSRRSSGELVGFPVSSGERITVRAGRSTHDVSLMVARIPGGVIPWPVADHQALDGEEARVMVGEDDEERQGRSVVQRDRLGTAFPGPRCGRASGKHRLRPCSAHVPTI